MPDITLASSITVRPVKSGRDRSRFVGGTARLQMASRWEGVAAIRYSAGLNALYSWWPREVFAGNVQGGDSELLLVPSGTAAALFAVGSVMEIGPELMAEYRSASGMQLWYGAGARVSGAGFPDITAAGRIGSTLGQTRFQGLFGLAFRLQASDMVG